MELVAWISDDAMMLFFQVLPSLDASFLITPCPSRLHDFIVRMDIVNRTNSYSFCLQQLSCVGEQWEISSLRTHAFICPSQVLFAGQALSCFFKLEVCIFYYEISMPAG